MLETRGRTAGRWRCPRPCGGGREPSGDKRSRQTTLQVWRAVCAETCKHRFGEGRLETCREATRWPPTLPKNKPTTPSPDGSTPESLSKMPYRMLCNETTRRCYTQSRRGLRAFLLCAATQHSIWRPNEIAGLFYFWLEVCSQVFSKLYFSYKLGFIK